MTSTIGRNKTSGYHPARHTLNKNPANKIKQPIVQDHFHLDIDYGEVGHLGAKTLLGLLHSHRWHECGTDPTALLINDSIYKQISVDIDTFVRKVQNLEPFGEGKEGLMLAEIEELHKLGEEIQEAFQKFWVPFIVASGKK